MSYPISEIDDVFMEGSEFSLPIPHDCPLSTNRWRFLLLKLAFIVSLFLQMAVLVIYVLVPIMLLLAEDDLRYGLDATVMTILLAVSMVFLGIFMVVVLLGMLRKQPTLLWIYLGFQVLCIPLIVRHSLAWTPELHYTTRMKVFEALIIPTQLLSVIMALFNISAMNTCRRCY